MKAILFSMSACLVCTAGWGQEESDFQINPTQDRVEEENDSAIPVGIRWKGCCELGITLASGIVFPLIRESDWNQPPVNYHDSLQSIRGYPKASIEVGIYFNLNINRWCRFKPQIKLAGRNYEIAYQRSDTLNDVATIRKDDFTIPLHMMFQPWDSIGYRPTFTIGPSLKFDVTKDKIDHPFDLAADIGIGVKKDFKLVSLQLEVLYSHGFFNMLKTKFNIYTETISTLKLHSLSLVMSIGSS